MVEPKGKHVGLWRGVNSEGPTPWKRNNTKSHTLHHGILQTTFTVLLHEVGKSLYNLCLTLVPLLCVLVGAPVLCVGGASQCQAQPQHKTNLDVFHCTTTSMFETFQTINYTSTMAEKAQKSAE